MHADDLAAPWSKRRLNPRAGWDRIVFRRSFARWTRVAQDLEPQQSGDPPGMMGESQYMPPYEYPQRRIEPNDQVRFGEDTGRPSQESAFGDEARLVDDFGQHRVALYSGARRPTLVYERQSVQGVVTYAQPLTKSLRQSCLPGTRYADQMDSHQPQLPTGRPEGQLEGLGSNDVARCVPFDAQA